MSASAACCFRALENLNGMVTAATARVRLDTACCTKSRACNKEEHSHRWPALRNVRFAQQMLGGSTICCSSLPHSHQPCCLSRRSGRRTARRSRFAAMQLARKTEAAAAASAAAGPDSELLLLPALSALCLLQEGCL